MQFHLNGFHAGDPTIAPPSPHAMPCDQLPGKVDVLIVGSGPAGLTLAAQLAAFPDIRTCLVERKDGPMQLGQADGIACRSMEMFAAFGFADRIAKEACWINEVTFWKPDDSQPGHIMRQGRVQDTEDGLSEFPHVVLNQARVHDFYLENMHHSPSRMQPFYSRSLVDLSIDASAADYPVTAQLEHATPDGLVQETVQARYVVGCDGARSSVRKAIGRQLEGDSANHAWGVMDVLVQTDFPDIRYKVAIKSEAGNILIIPREGGYMTRLYVEMDKLDASERVSDRNLTPAQLIAAAQRIMHPYQLDVKEVMWWSVYEIGQRICQRYDDSDGTPGSQPRVFIAGDACHTHSPKAGQGMNFSMQDTFNLGWKLAAVLRGQASPALLHTYTEERQTVAQELIDFDREWTTMFNDRGHVDPAVFQKYFEQHGRFTAGVGTHYRQSLIQGANTHQALASGFIIGMRFHSAPVVRVCDARPMHLGHVAEADGRWRLYAFAGTCNPDGVRALCDFLGTSPNSPILRYTPTGQDPDARFDLRAIFQQNHRDIAIETLPGLLLPRKGKYQLQDYEKTFCADPRPSHDIYDLRGIDRQQGALLIVRPDQYVAHVLPLDAHAQLAQFFDAFLLP